MLNASAVVNSECFLSQHNIEEGEWMKEGKEKVGEGRKKRGKLQLSSSVFLAVHVVVIRRSRS